MARNDPKQHGSSGKIKFRVIEFEMEGGNERLEQGLRTLAQAITQQAELPRTISGQRSRPSPALNPGDDSSSLSEQDDSPELAYGDTETEEIQTSSNQPRPRPRPTPKAPKFLSNLNLASGSIKLEDFVSAKDPKDMQERYIVIVEWLKENLATEEVTVDHIFTAYKHLGWQSQLPPDPAQPLRDLKYKKHWLDAGAAKASFKINWSGTNYVNKMGVTTEK